MKYVSIIVTHCPACATLHNASIYTYDTELKLVSSYTTTYEEGMRELRKLERKLGRVAAMDVHPYMSDLSHKSLSGFLDRA